MSRGIKRFLHVARAPFASLNHLMRSLQTQGQSRWIVTLLNLPTKSATVALQFLF